MKVKCKIKVNNDLEELVPSFEIILKYKLEGKVFYEKESLLYLSVFSSVVRDSNKGFKTILAEKLNKFNSKSEEEFIKTIKEVILMNNKMEVENKTKEKSLNEEIKKIKDITKTFVVEI